MDKQLIADIPSDILHTKVIRVPTFKKGFIDSSDTIKNIVSNKYKCKITIENETDGYKLIKIPFIVDSRTDKVMLIHNIISDKLVEINDDDIKKCRLSWNDVLEEQLCCFDNNIIYYIDQYEDYNLYMDPNPLSYIVSMLDKDNIIYEYIRDDAKNEWNPYITTHIRIPYIKGIDNEKDIYLLKCDIEFINEESFELALMSGVIIKANNELERYINSLFDE